MKNQPAFKECAFPVRAAVGISYAVRFGTPQFIHGKTPPFGISTGSKPNLQKKHLPDWQFV
jgi:hypothetical protein